MNDLKKFCDILSDKQKNELDINHLIKNIKLISHTDKCTQNQIDKQNNNPLQKFKHYDKICPIISKIINDYISEYATIINDRFKYNEVSSLKKIIMNEFNKEFNTLKEELKIDYKIVDNYKYYITMNGNFYNGIYKLSYTQFIYDNDNNNFFYINTDNIDKLLLYINKRETDLSSKGISVFYNDINYWEVRSQ